MVIPNATPTNEARRKASTKRSRVLEAWIKSIPLPRRRTKVDTMVTTPGKSFGGNGPRREKASHRIETTTKGRTASATGISVRRMPERTILEPTLGFPKKLFIEALANVRNGSETPFPASLQKVLGLIGKIFLDLGRDIGFPAHSPQCFIEDRYGHAPTGAFLLLPV